MIRSKIALVLASLMLAAMWAAPGHAAEERLERDGLYAMLENMGLQVRKDVYEGGYHTYVKTKAGGLDLEFRVVLSPNGKKIWFEQYLAKFSPENKSRIPWQKMVGMQATKVPAMFNYVDETGDLYLEYTISNVNIKPVTLREAMEEFGQSVVDTRELWDVAKWNPQTADAAGKRP